MCLPNCKGIEQGLRPYRVASNTGRGQTVFFSTRYSFRISLWPDLFFQIPDKQKNKEPFEDTIKHDVKIIVGTDQVTQHIGYPNNVDRIRFHKLHLEVIEQPRHQRTKNKKSNEGPPTAEVDIKISEDTDGHGRLLG